MKLYPELTEVTYVFKAFVLQEREREREEIREKT